MALAVTDALHGLLSSPQVGPGLINILQTWKLRHRSTQVTCPRFYTVEILKFPS